MPGSRRRWIGLLVLIVLVVGCVRLADRPMPISYYRVVDDRTLMVGAESGPGEWTRVTGVEESADRITIFVGFLQVPLPSGQGATPIELEVKLRDPLGSRAVFDGSDGSPVTRTSCRPPDLVYPSCPGYTLPPS